MTETKYNYVEKELLCLYNKHANDIDTILLKMKIYSSVSSISLFSNIATEVFACCIPIIIKCSTSTEYNVDSYFKQRVIKHSKKYKINLYQVPYYIRLHIAMISCFKCLINYIERKHKKEFTIYVENTLPLRYIRDLNNEIRTCKLLNVYSQNIHNQVDINIYNNNIVENINNYIDNYLLTNVKKYSEQYFIYIGRENIYKLIKTIKNK